MHFAFAFCIQLLNTQAKICLCMRAFSAAKQKLVVARMCIYGRHVYMRGIRGKEKRRACQIRSRTDIHIYTTQYNNRQNKRIMNDGKLKSHRNYVYYYLIHAYIAHF